MFLKHLKSEDWLNFSKGIAKKKVKKLQVMLACWLSDHKLKFKHSFIAWILSHSFASLACGHYKEKSQKKRALWINSDFLQDATGVQTRNTGLPYFYFFFFNGFTVLKKIISCWVLPKIKAEAIWARQGICFHLFQDEEFCVSSLICLRNQILYAPSDLGFCWHQREFRSPCTFPYPTLGF